MEMSGGVVLVDLSGRPTMRRRQRPNRLRKTWEEARAAGLAWCLAEIEAGRRPAIHPMGDAIGVEPTRAGLIWRDIVTRGDLVIPPGLTRPRRARGKLTPAEVKVRQERRTPCRHDLSPAVRRGPEPARPRRARELPYPLWDLVVEARKRERRIGIWHAAARI